VTGDRSQVAESDRHETQSHGSYDTTGHRTRKRETHNHRYPLKEGVGEDIEGGSRTNSGSAIQPYSILFMGHHSFGAEHASTGASVYERPLPTCLSCIPTPGGPGNGMTTEDCVLTGTLLLGLFSGHIVRYDIRGPPSCPGQSPRWPDTVPNLTWPPAPCSRVGCATSSSIQFNIIWSVAPLWPSIPIHSLHCTLDRTTIYGLAGGVLCVLGVTALGDGFATKDGDVSPLRAHSRGGSEAAIPPTYVCRLHDMPASALVLMDRSFALYPQPVDNSPTPFAPESSCPLFLSTSDDGSVKCWSWPRHLGTTLCAGNTGPRYPLVLESTVLDQLEIATIKSGEYRGLCSDPLGLMLCTSSLLFGEAIDTREVQANRALGRNHCKISLSPSPLLTDDWVVDLEASVTVLLQICNLNDATDLCHGTTMSCDESLVGYVLSLLHTIERSDSETFAPCGEIAVTHCTRSSDGTRLRDVILDRFNPNRQRSDDQQRNEAEVQGGEGMDVNVPKGSKRNAETELGEVLPLKQMLMESGSVDIDVQEESLVTIEVDGDQAGDDVVDQMQKEESAPRVSSNDGVVEELIEDLPVLGPRKEYKKKVGAGGGLADLGSLLASQRIPILQSRIEQCILVQLQAAVHISVGVASRGQEWMAVDDPTALVGTGIEAVEGSETLLRICNGEGTGNEIAREGTGDGSAYECSHL